MSQDVAEALKGIQEGTRLPRKAPGALSDLELFWRDNQPWLKECGYDLRPRYQPDWTPSWKASGRQPESCEDGQPLVRKYMMDAIQIQTGSFVILKRITKSYHPSEVEIGQYFSSPSLRQDPANHCVPILDILNVPNDDTRVIIVMPLLRKFDDPPFNTIGEVLECVSQAFQGVAFMHQHNVAHRDCSASNFMMDCRDMFPVPFHPQVPDRTRDFRGTVRPRSRLAYPPKYLFIDFGISRLYRDEDLPPSEPIIVGADKSPPEYEYATDGNPPPMNPFYTDVYLVGNLVREHFLKKYKNLDFLDSLVTSMVQDDVTKRPSMTAVVSSFDKMRRVQGQTKADARLRHRNESYLGMLYRDVSHTVRGVLRSSPRSSSR